MIKFLRHSLGLISVLIVVASALRVLGWVYAAMLPDPLPYSDSQRQAVQEASQEVQAWCATLPLERQSAAFGNLAHDPVGFVSGPVRAALWRSGRFDLAPRSFWERLRSRLGWTLPSWPADASLVAYGQARGTELAIGGAVTGFADDPKPSLGVHLEVVEVATGRPVAAKDFVLQSSAALRPVNPPLSSAAPSQRALLVWIAVILTLPLAVLPFGRTLLVEGSNAAILLTLFGLIAFDVGSAYLLYAGQWAGWAGAALILLLVGVSFALNLNYLTWLKALSL